MLYDDIKFTRHASERLKLRNIPRDMALAVIKNPDLSYYEHNGDTKFIREIEGRTIHVVCVPMQRERMWLVKTVWVRGENDDGTVTKRKSNDQWYNDLNRLVLLMILTLIILVGIAGIAWYYTQ